MTPAEAMRAWVLTRDIDELELGIRARAIVDHVREARGVPLRSPVTIADALAAHEIGRAALLRLPSAKPRVWDELESALVEVGLVEAGGTP